MAAVSKTKKMKNTNFTFFKILQYKKYIYFRGPYTLPPPKVQYAPMLVIENTHTI